MVNPSANKAISKSAKWRANAGAAASLVVWLTATSRIWDLSGHMAATMMLWALGGGAVAGAVGALRAPKEPGGKSDGWIFFRMITTFAASMTWMFILHDIWENSDMDSHWAGFFWGLLAYSLVRDLTFTGVCTSLARHTERQEETRRHAQRARVIAMMEAKQLAENPNTATILHLPIESP